MSTANAAEKITAMPAADFERCKNALLRRTRRAGRSAASWRCTLCGSRIEVQLLLDDNDKETGSRGACRTAGCLHWED